MTQIQEKLGDLCCIWQSLRQVRAWRKSRSPILLDLKIFQFKLLHCMQISVSLLCLPVVGLGGAHWHLSILNVSRTNNLTRRLIRFSCRRNAVPHHCAIPCDQTRDCHFFAALVRICWQQLLLSRSASALCFSLQGGFAENGNLGGLELRWTFGLMRSSLQFVHALPFLHRATGADPNSRAHSVRLLTPRDNSPFDSMRKNRPRDQTPDRALQVSLLAMCTECSWKLKGAGERQGGEINEPLVRHRSDPHAFLVPLELEELFDCFISNWQCFPSPSAKQS